jgi:enediyne biosynthesis protein E3
MVRSELQTEALESPSQVLFRRARERVFSLSPIDASFKRRGFYEGSAEKQRQFERIGETFITGFNFAVALDVGKSLTRQLEAIEKEFRGFAYEGAAMGLLLMDGLLPGRSCRFRWLVEEAGASHMYMLSVGGGWALARLPWVARRVERAFYDNEPIVTLLSVDGAGFHNGYFKWKTAGVQQRMPSRFRNYERRAFDQGLGRAMWFVHCGDVEQVACDIARFAATRKPDLWSGVGLAVTYAGAADEADLYRLLWRANGYEAVVAQGAAFAAKARVRAGLIVPHTELACRVLCSMSAEQAANLTDTVLRELPRRDQSAYEAWRDGIQDALIKFSPASWAKAPSVASHPRQHECAW